MIVHCEGNTVLQISEYVTLLLSEWNLIHDALFFRFSLVSEQNFLNAKINDN